MNLMKMIFIGKFFINHLLKGEENSMDFNHIEKKLFSCILFISLLVSLTAVFLNSLLALYNLYLLRLGFSEINIALINLAIVGSLIAVIALVTGIYMKKLFPKKQNLQSIDAIPNVISNCISAFIKGYKET